MNVHVHDFPYKLGKQPAVPDSIKLRFDDFADIKELRKLLPPLRRPIGPLGHINSIREKDWGMLANDKWGCCVFSGAAHETKLFLGLAGKQSWFSDKEVLADYHDATGFNWTEATDQGSNMQKVAKYRQDYGIRDGHGVRHKIDAYLAIDAGNLEQHLMALWLFGAVGVGIEVPRFAPIQFNQGLPWDVMTTNTDIIGGHYIPLLGWTGVQMRVVTWALNQGMSERFLARYNDESVAYLSSEMLKNRKSPEGFDYDTLVVRLQELRKIA